MRIKVCGMTQIDQVHALEEMGIDFTGFIFYHKSPRYVVGKIQPEDLAKSRLKINKVGVFVNASYEEVMQHVEEYGLYMVQLHGDESPRLCEKLSEQIPVIKAFRIKEGDNIDWKVREYSNVSDLYLFDTDWANYGGSGRKFNWNILERAQISKPFLLSGGIGLDDVETIKTFAAGKHQDRLFAVDVNSMFETSPGIKDMGKLRRFAEKLR
ncbi:MAG: phosphoribosylanthranilate isomerase [Chitinophagaceae bacterium]|nr:phosphoribosylanthranilate isomerase [Chitinophagaceae bacterium]MCW5927577.1 phosphoribosylanthranilate isomerase [Chitinophagaceae bacterium]